MNRVAAYIENTRFSRIPFVTPRFYLILAAKNFRENRHKPVRQFLVAIELGNQRLCICAFSRPHPFKIVRIMNRSVYRSTGSPIKRRIAFRAKHLVAIMHHRPVLKQKQVIAIGVHPKKGWRPIGTNSIVDSLPEVVYVRKARFTFLRNIKYSFTVKYVACCSSLGACFDKTRNTNV